MKVGINLLKSETGGGPVIKTVTAGSLADGRIQPGRVIVSINGTDVRGLVMKEVMGLIMSAQVLNFVFEPTTLAEPEQASNAMKAADSSASIGMNSDPASQYLAASMTVVCSVLDCGFARGVLMGFTMVLGDEIEARHPCDPLACLSDLRLCSNSFHYT
jgi:hypothetical protein